MTGFWFGCIVGAFVMAFINSLARENGFARQFISWVVEKVNSLGTKTG